MDFNKLKAKLDGAKKKTPTHLNLGVVVNTLPDGATTITIPSVVDSGFLYESPLKEVVQPDGKVKKTGGNPMVYCLPQSPDPKIKRMVFPVKFNQIGPDGTVVTQTLLLRMSGFSLFVNDVADSEE